MQCERCVLLFVGLRRKLLRAGLACCASGWAVVCSHVRRRAGCAQQAAAARRLARCRQAGGPAARRGRRRAARQRRALARPGAVGRRARVALAQPAALGRRGQAAAARAGPDVGPRREVAAAARGEVSPAHQAARRAPGAEALQTHLVVFLERPSRRDAQGELSDLDLALARARSTALSPQAFDDRALSADELQHYLLGIRGMLHVRRVDARPRFRGCVTVASGRCCRAVPAGAHACAQEMQRIRDRAPYGHTQQLSLNIPPDAQLTKVRPTCSPAGALLHIAPSCPHTLHAPFDLPLARRCSASCWPRRCRTWPPDPASGRCAAAPPARAALECEWWPRAGASLGERVRQDLTLRRWDPYPHAGIPASTPSRRRSSRPASGTRCAQAHGQVLGQRGRRALLAGNACSGRCRSWGSAGGRVGRWGCVSKAVPARHPECVRSRSGRCWSSPSSWARRRRSCL